MCASVLAILNCNKFHIQLTYTPGESWNLFFQTFLCRVIKTKHNQKPLKLISCFGKFPPDRFKGKHKVTTKHRSIDKTMDIVKLAGIFQATLDQNQHEQAEKQLEQVRFILFWFFI